MVKRKVVNIEIGERLVKVCETVTKKQSGQVLHSFMFQTPENTVNDGMITDYEALSQKLHAEFKRHQITNRNVVFSIVSGKVATREVKIPPVKDNRIKAVVETNAPEYFPVETSKYVITHALLERVDKGADAGCRILVIAVPNNILDSYFKLAEYAKFQVQSIDYSGNAQYRALKQMSGKEVTMFVDVDCNYSGISVIRDGKLLMQRSFAVGGEQLIENYMNATEKPDSEYLKAMGELMVTDERKPEALLTPEEINESLSRLVSNVVRIVDYFNSSNWQTPIERMVLVGVCGNLLGLRESIKENLEISVENAQTINGFNVTQLSQEPITCYVSCIGSSIQPVELIPEKYGKFKKRDRSVKESGIKDGVIICAVCLVAGIALVGYSQLNYLKAKKQKLDLEKQIEELKYVDEIYFVYNDYKTQTDGLNELKKIASTPNEELVAFIEELEEKMPSEITVLSASCEVTGVNMNVEVSTKEAAAKVISQLRSFESIDKINISGIAEAENDTGIKKITFSVGCEYVKKPYVVAQPQQ